MTVPWNAITTTIATRTGAHLVVHDNYWCHCSLPVLLAALNCGAGVPCAQTAAAATHATSCSVSSEEMGSNPGWLGSSLDDLSEFRIALSTVIVVVK